MPALTARLARESATAGLADPGGVEDATAQGPFSVHGFHAPTSDPSEWWTLSHQPERDMSPRLATGRRR